MRPQLSATMPHNYSSQPLATFSIKFLRWRTVTMELQTNPALRIRTPRVKAIAKAENYPEVLICLFTGEIQMYNRNSLTLTRSAKVSNVPVRTGVLVPSRDWILLGTDDGTILVLDIGNLSIINTVQAHDDFVRKIVLDEHPRRFITVSDDNTAKLWSYEKNITMIHKYKAHHFVMDACFCPDDHGLFVTVSLDCKAYLYSIEHTKPLKVFKGHTRGVNCVSFISNSCFVTGSDDCSIIAWDYKRGVQVTKLAAHSKNVNFVKRIRGGFASCSDDGTAKLWDETFNRTTILSVAGRAWALEVLDDRVFIGSDEELIVFLEQKAKKLACMASGRFFFNANSTLKATRLDDQAVHCALESSTDDTGVPKDIGTLDDGFTAISATENGKFIAVCYENHFTVYSTLGLRKKLTEIGTNALFIDNETLIFQRDDLLLCFRNFENIGTFQVGSLCALVHADSRIVVLNTTNGDTNDTLVFRTPSFLTSNQDSTDDICAVRLSDASCRLPLTVTGAFSIGEFSVLMADKVYLYDESFQQRGVLDCQVESYSFAGDMVVFSASQRTFYGFIIDGSIKTFHLPHLPGVFGISGDLIYYMDKSPMAYRINREFVNFQLAVLRNPKSTPTIAEHIVDKAIAFYESLEMHENALSICRNDNQKFEIYLKLGSFDRAFEIANSPIKFKKLAQACLRQGCLDMAVDCFYRAGDLQSVLFVDVFHQKKYLAKVASAAEERGENNLALMAHYKDGNYRKCAELLKSTPFYTSFVNSYCPGSAPN